MCHLAVGVLVDDEGHMADWPMGFAPGTLLQRRCGTPHCARSHGQIPEKADYPTRSAVFLSARPTGVNFWHNKLTPIFSKSSSISDGRAADNDGAAGNPTYLATPDMTETS